ncbi:MAG: ABC transporter permease [Cellvibrio sp.]|uniref:ABC transporter permease n=1 Tax=Cellvibrio sp. TaxID=1965322 RepID=UPI0031B18622
MIDIDKWQEILKSLSKQKVRTALTAFGVFWGILMLVVLLGFGTGFGNKVIGDFGENTNVVLMWSSNSTQLPYMGLSKGRRIGLTQEDVDAIREKVPGVKMVDGKNSIGGWGSPTEVIYEQESGSFSVSGSHAGWLPYEFGNMSKIVEGRYINQLDELQKRKVAVIGTRVKELLFKHEKSVLGKSISIQGVHFVVIGVYKNISTGEGGDDSNSSIMVPNETARRAFNAMEKFDLIFFTPKPGYSAVDLEQRVKELIYERKKVHPDDKGVLATWNHEKFFKEQQNLVLGILGFSWMVAIGTIIAGVIGVGNIMLIVIKERTREIGLRKALGATPLNISLMIMHESLVITLLAGYSGLVVGVVLLEVIKVVLVKLGQGDGMFASPFIDIGTALLALAVLVITGVLAALLPAIKAASVNPIVALQDE